MQVLRLRLKERSYDIFVGNRMLAKASGYPPSLSLGKDAVIITNPLIQELHGKTLALGLKRGGFSVATLTVPDGEQSKSAKCAFGLMERLARYDVDKKIFIVALGGGVVGDLAGFVAATYKRGVPFLQVPTTLLAQIDSAIGGKVGIDLAVGKNLVGAFYQPRRVLSDVSLLSTLSARQIRNGLAEAVKYGVIADAELFHYVERNYAPLLLKDPKCLEELVVRCSRIKARVVAADEQETKGLRTILNFGHTVGHAVESAGGYKLYQHGEAVALGMRVAATLSVGMKLLSVEDCGRLDRLLSCIGLPQRIRGLSLARILKPMAHDKKFQSGRNRFVLARDIGRVIVREGIPQALIKKAIRSRMA